VLASANLANTRATRRRGLIGVAYVENPLVITPCRWIHTFGTRVDLDVAYLDEAGTVIKMCRISPMRITAPVRTARQVIEAAEGSFERWNLRLGDRVEVRGQ
jgi:uncharacterized membrane protein (UPF0127 family)